MISKFRDTLRIIPFTSFFGTAALLWDAWWHGAIGRDTFWSPPHVLLYLAFLVGFAAAIWQLAADRKARRVDRRLIVFIVTSALIFLAAPFDEVWHDLFGKESLSSILIVWSPPHLVTLISAIVGGLAIWRLVLSRFPGSHLLHLLQATPTLTTALFVAFPLEPIGLHHLVGWYGSFFMMLVVVFLVLFFARAAPLRGTATLVAILHFAVVSVANLGEGIAPVVSAPPHPHVPAWLSFFSLLAAGLVIDGFVKRSRLQAGLAAGLLHSFLLYTVGRLYIEPVFVYDLAAITTAVAAGAAGGLVAGILASFVTGRIETVEKRDLHPRTKIHS